MDFKHNFKKYGILSVRPPPGMENSIFFFLFFLKASLRYVFLKKEQKASLKIEFLLFLIFPWMELCLKILIEALYVNNQQRQQNEGEK